MFAAAILRFSDRPCARLGCANALLALAGFVPSCQPVNSEAPGPKPRPPARTAALQERPAGYVEKLPGGVEFTMVGIPGGTFTMGSPPAEAGRDEVEGPQRLVAVSPFWIGRCEVTWDEYDLWGASAEGVDGVARPTAPYVDMSFGMGRGKRPAICMTWHAASTYCEWLSKVTGRRYRLPTEAEWEYACRAGTATPWSCGGDPEALDDFAWHAGNSGAKYHEVGTRRPNPWGLCDLHGNVAEWTLDALAAYAAGQASDPLVRPTALHPRVVRGGSWADPVAAVRSAARRGSHDDWSVQDPQLPKSIWYHTDADFVGFRVVREWRPGER